MWYQNSYRRHLCDMHIDDWSEELLSQFSPEEYFQNLKTAKVQNAMLYFQSHVGLCYFPTGSGKIHNSFRGREDAMKQLVDLCRNNGISVTGYYSLIYNNWAHDAHPEWRMITREGVSRRESENEVFRYGLCCPNNQEYRKFVAEQIGEMCDYFTVDGMFFDMPFWNHVCYCDSCRRRWAEEVGGEMPVTEDWQDPAWLNLMDKLRQWMGEFAQFAYDELKKRKPDVSVEMNAAFAGLPDGQTGLAEEVLNATDYAGGDLYGGLYNHSFVCKLYRNVTRNQPFEYMFSRCSPNLARHTVTKSEDEIASSVFLTAAHHGATLVIDAIDPIGTMDSRVYERVGRVFEKEIRYEPYFEGEMQEDVGVYYSLRSKYNAYGEKYCNHNSCLNTVKTMIMNHICCGVTGNLHSLENYPVLIASGLTERDAGDYERLISYVKNGGQLYFSGGDCPELLHRFFGADIVGRTEESVVYIAPGEKAGDSFGWFTAKFPMHFDGTAPVAEGIDSENVAATITLPFTGQNEKKFVSIHSNPPGIASEIPAMAVTEYGKGKVFWSALPIEEMEAYQYRSVFLKILEQFFVFEKTIRSDAQKDIEIICFKAQDAVYVNVVLMSEEDKARHVDAFKIQMRCNKQPKQVSLLPDGKSVDYIWHDGIVEFDVKDLGIFAMYKIEL